MQGLRQVFLDAHRQPIGVHEKARYPAKAIRGHGERRIDAMCVTAFERPA